MKRHPRAEELGINVYQPTVNINTDKAAHAAYLRFNRVLGLVPFEPPSDAQRIAFDYAYGDSNVDFEQFMQHLAEGMALRDSYIAARKVVEE